MWLTWAATLAVVDLFKRWRLAQRADDSATAPELRPMRFWAAATWVLVAAGVSFLVGMWLLGVWSPVPAGVADPEQWRLERIRTGLTVVAGAAAGVGLLMALRRQSLSERAQRFAEQAQRFAEAEALEQRTTALYVVAADQLASDKAAVRLAGMYALERLGQDNPKLRQTVFDVWCAYLRMPYTPPLEVLRLNAKSSPAFPGPDAESAEEKEEQRRQELEVRLTAQRLLAAHLRITDSYWYIDGHCRLDLDLSRAVLVDFDLSKCAPARVRLDKAQFHGFTRLEGAEFHDDAYLVDAQFHGYTNLDGAEFHGDACPAGAQFHDTASLISTQFHGEAYLGGVQFHSFVQLAGAQFHGRTELLAAQFYSYASLDEAQFPGGLTLHDAQATNSARLPPGWTLATGPADGPLRPIIWAAAATTSSAGTEATRLKPNDLGTG